MPATPSNQQPGAKAQPPARPLTKRAITRRQREAQRQRTLLTIVGATVALAALIVLFGVLYDQVWIPSRPVASVGSTTLSRSDYWRERRYELARQVSQNIQLVSLFGGSQSASQFTGRVPILNQDARNIRTAPLDDATVTRWQDSQLTIQGAATITNAVTVSRDEVNQQLVADLGIVFLPPPVITPTASISPTASTAITATSALTPTVAPTLTPGGPTSTPLPTLTLAPTFTPAPTSTTQPTPGVAEANQQAEAILDDLFARYRGEVTNGGQEPVLTREDFAQALFDQYNLQVYQRKIQEQLVPEDGFQAVTTPNRVRASQILLRVEVVSGTAQADIDALFSQRLPDAQAIVQELRDDADFATIAGERSEDPGSKDQGGDLGFFDDTGKTDEGYQYAPAVVEAAFALPENEISEPIRTDFGWVIVKNTSRVVESIEDQLRRVRSDALDAWLTNLRTTLTTERFPATTPTVAVPTTAPAPTLVPTYVSGPPTPVPTTAPITDTGTLSDTGTLPSTDVLTTTP